MKEFNWFLTWLLGVGIPHSVVFYFHPEVDVHWYVSMLIVLAFTAGQVAGYFFMDKPTVVLVNPTELVATEERAS